MERSFNKQKKFHVKSGDTVKILSGKHRGETGKVLRILTKKDRVVVEGKNMVTKHVKPSATKPEGGIEKVEAAIHISNVMLVDPKTGDATRTGRKLVDGKLQRYSKKSGEIIK